jgi:cholesterol oxidase
VEYDVDYLVVWSGFGGSVSACRLRQKGYSFSVMEMGRRCSAEKYPPSTWHFHRWMWRPMLGPKGFFNIKQFKHVRMLHGNAVGGGSITYANTLLIHKPEMWEQGRWAGLKAWCAEMPAHYATAQKMLGVTESRILGPADHILPEAADDWGSGDTFYKT